MFCYLRKGTKRLRDQAGNHKSNPIFCFPFFFQKRLMSAIVMGSLRRLFVPSRSPQLIASLLKLRWPSGEVGGRERG